MSNTITWDPAKLRRFEAVYQAAIHDKDLGEVFNFEGHEFVASYAKYLIEYLKGRLA